MPENLTMGFFAFGAVLILISLLGGGFNIFSFAVSTTISSPLIRITSFILGTTSILLALNPDISPFPSDATNTPTPVVIESPQNIPPPTQTSVQPTQPIPLSTQALPPTVIYETPTPSVPSPVEFVVSYWQNVSDGRYQNAWAQLSPGFRRARHNDDYNDYLRGYQEMNLCRIVVSNVNLMNQDVYSAVITAHFTYYTGAQCNLSEYNFEMWLIYDGASNSWLFDRNIFKQ